MGYPTSWFLRLGLLVLLGGMLACGIASDGKAQQSESSGPAPASSDLPATTNPSSPRAAQQAVAADGAVADAPPATGQAGSAAPLGEGPSQPPSQPKPAGAEPVAAAPAAGERRANHLAGETSPYLRLHLHNPVDWYPWGPAALEKARRENKPIFLSIGYSSCHWCHVMEKESFSDEQIAALLNQHFVCIKVDREERPDIDTIYMTALQIYMEISSGRRGGGWPLSMFLLPDGRPFFGGTYFPARDGDRGVATGFLTLVQKIVEIWKATPERVEQDAAVITRLTKTELESRRPVAIEPLDQSIVEATQAALLEQFDPEWGGFGFDADNPWRPKFPEPSNLLFLVRRWQQTKDARLLELLTKTLDKMAEGGIRDHLGGGFHRYSVDRLWRIPHFEKMLYDNGQLATVYAEAYALTGRAEYRQVVEELLSFVKRELTHEGGAFYAALDADSEGEEGAFYRWTQEEVERLLTAEQFRVAVAVYGIQGPPNFEDQYFVLQLSEPLPATAQRLGLSVAQLSEQLEPIRKRLLETREKRIRPLTDTKILTAWNGLMIRGYADAGRLLKQPEYVEAAVRAAKFVLQHNRDEQGRLLRSYDAGKARFNAYLDDYAFLVDGLLALHQATQDRQWLETAEQLTQSQIEHFWDPRSGGFFFTSNDHESLLARSRTPFDGAVPAGNSVAAANLLFLGQALKKPDYVTKAGQTIESVSGTLKALPDAAPRMVVAVSQWLEQKP
jgi:hypothetical protein